MYFKNGHIKDMKRLLHNLPHYLDRLGLSDVENTKDPQRSPELKTQTCAKVDQQLQSYIINVLGPKPFTSGHLWKPHAVLPLGDQNKK